MNVSNFGAKFGTKGEIYRFLTVEAGIFLPSYQTVTIWHMKDLCSGEKTVSSSFSSTTFIGHRLRGCQGHRCTTLREPNPRPHPRLRPLLPRGRGRFANPERDPQDAEVVHLQRDLHSRWRTFQEVGFLGMQRT